MTRTRFAGGCQCGSIRYEIEGEIGYPHLCHCRMCQKASGNYALPLGSAKRAKFRLTRGEPRWFFSSHLVRRGFCETCGTPLFFDVPGEDFINVTLGSLDDPQSVMPVAQSNLQSKMHWFDRLNGLPVEPVSEDDSRETSIADNNRQHPDHDTDIWEVKR